MKESTEKSHSPFTTLGVIIVVSIICLLWNWTHPRLSNQHSIDFLVQHQQLLEEYVNLSRPHALEAKDVWERIKQLQYFTSVDRYYDRNGAIAVYFSASNGEWIHFAEGNYKICYCLLWMDADYDSPGNPLSPYWNLLGEEDGIAITQDGNWYYISHKHYDG